MKNSNINPVALSSKIVKSVLLSAIFISILVLGGKTFAQPHARVENTNFHIVDSDAPYGCKCDTQLKLYTDDGFGELYSAADPNNVYPSSGYINVLVNMTNMYVNNAYSGDAGQLNCYMNDAVYTIATDQYVDYHYSDIWGGNNDTWDCYYDVVSNPSESYIPELTTTEFYY